MNNINERLERVISDAVRDGIKQGLDETSRRQKAQQAIQGKNRRVKTMAIISAQNPMGTDGSELPKDYNKESHEELLHQLKVGQFRYFVTDGKYGTRETSVIVYNISLDDTLYLCYHYNQESVIFVDMTDENEVSYQYWEGDDHTSRLRKQYEEHEIIDATNNEDYYTKISKHFKFRIPFFESVCSYTAELNERSRYYDVNRLIDECLESGWSGKHKYFNRGKINGKLKPLK